MSVLLEKGEAGGFVREGAFYNGSAGCVPMVFPVVATTVSAVQNVWVEGRYVDQVQANGTVVRVWQPGHYEQRTVVVQ